MVININDTIYFKFFKEKTYIGRKNGDPVPDIILGGMGIKPVHALIINEENDLSVEPMEVLYNL